MGEHVVKLPDVGEGIAEAELVEWHVKVGDLIREDQLLAAVMTDKATVEIPSPVEGKVIWLGFEVGDQVAIGSPIVRLEVVGEGNVGSAAKAGAGSTPTPNPSPQGGGGQPAAARKPKADAASAKSVTAAGGSGRAESGSANKAGTAGAEKATVVAGSPSSSRAGVKSGGTSSAASIGAPRPEGERPLASPAVRLRAREAGIDLRQVPGSGPAGRIGHEDIDAFLSRGTRPAARAGLQPNEGVEDIKVVGLRRKIAEKMAIAKSRIPHITYVEEVDVTALEELRAALNKEKKADRPKLTILPFLMRAMVKAIAEEPVVNAIYDDEAGVIHRHGGVHIGMAAQTPAGLVVPVVRHAEARDIWDCAAEVNRLAEAAKAGTATREELSGSTITITSLGAMGGIATTPVINHPEVAIVGVNKIAVRPMWDGTQFVPRKMMNLSSSFDHRVVDGWNAAVFVQRIKTLLETPALIFVEG